MKITEGGSRFFPFLYCFILVFLDYGGVTLGEEKMTAKEEGKARYDNAPGRLEHGLFQHNMGMLPCSVTG